jgi:dimethylargininase
MQTLVALTRGVSPRIAECEVTFIERQVIDYSRAVKQHSQYQQLLRNLGAKVIELPSDERCPDCCFLEDTALVLNEVAVVTRPGSDVRRREVESVAPAIMKFRDTVRIDAPGTLEAGDVLRLGRKLFVGISTRTNQRGMEMLRAATQTYGYEVVGIAMKRALHLKSVCTAIDDDTVLADKRYFDSAEISKYKLIEVPAEESIAANVLRINGVVCMHAGFHRTADLLQNNGFDVRTLDISEFLKAEAGLTCMSIILYASDTQVK